MEYEINVPKDSDLDLFKNKFNFTLQIAKNFQLIKKTLFDMSILDLFYHGFEKYLEHYTNYVDVDENIHDTQPRFNYLLSKTKQQDNKIKKQYFEVFRIFRNSLHNGGKCSVEKKVPYIFGKHIFQFTKNESIKYTDEKLWFIIIQNLIVILNMSSKIHKFK